MYETLKIETTIRKKLTAKLKRKSRRKLFSYEKINGIIRDVFKITPSSPKEASQFLPIDGGSAGQAFIALLKFGEIESLPGHAYYGYDQSFLNELSEPLKLEKMISSS